jgi:hypothetical protein
MERNPDMAGTGWLRDSVIYRGTPQLRTAATTTVLASGYPLIYVRGDRHLVVINPSGTARTADIPSLAARTARPLSEAAHWLSSPARSLK